VTNRSAIKITISDSEKNEEVANLSAAVVHEAAFPESGVAQNILSALFIESELTGFIETPAGFFNNNEINAKDKQRLLMLTNDRSNYFWNQAPTATKQLNHKQSAGLKLHGKATEATTGLPLKNGEITLVIEKNREMAFLTQNTDTGGYFTFSGLLFNDTARVIVQARTERGRPNTAIQLLPQFEIPLQSEKIKSLGAEPAFTEAIEKQKYQQQLSLTNYLRKQGSLLPAKETAETEEKADSDDRFRIYDKADQVIEIPESEASFGNVLDFLAGKVAGLDITENSVSIRGTSNIDGNSTPLFLIDGVPLNSGGFSDLPAEVGGNKGDVWSAGETSAIDKIKTLPLGDIEKVEILKSPQNLAIFGTEGANGVIAVYTRKGKSDTSSALAK
ncbi:MAG: TonB-dependent receptor plug domain-containing protein, partial [Mariniphaga sp.]